MLAQWTRLARAGPIRALPIVPARWQSATTRQSQSRQPGLFAQLIVVLPLKRSPCWRTFDRRALSLVIPERILAAICRSFPLCGAQSRKIEQETARGKAHRGRKTSHSAGKIYAISRDFLQSTDNKHITYELPYSYPLKQSTYVKSASAPFAKTKDLRPTQPKPD